jgi:methyl-accepting chemotaxis protein
MGAIANYQKRRAAERALKANFAEAKEQVINSKAPENEALALLASLLGVEQEKAIEAASKFGGEECLIISQADALALQREVDDAQNKSYELLELLAKLLACEEENAVEQAKELVEKGAYIAGLTEEQLDKVQHQIGVDLASGEDKAVIVNVKGGQIESITELAKQTATDLEQSAGAVEGAADAVTGAAEQVGSAAADLEDTASQLAYTADSIGQATAELQEATAELKKPLAVQESLPGKTADKPKNNSKK